MNIKRHVSLIALFAIVISLSQPAWSMEDSVKQGIKRKRPSSQSNKVEVKKAVEAAYKVKVTQVNIITNQGKSRNFGRTSGMTSGFKKAIVTLRKGDKIEGMTETI